MALRTELPYSEGSARLFEAVRQARWPVWLDSGRPLSRQGRYDIIAADPVCTLVTRGALTEIATRESVELSREDPLELLRARLRMRSAQACDLPITGGAIGYFSYDLARRFERLPMLAEDCERLPEMAVGIYRWTAIVDHLEQRAWLASCAPDAELRERWPALVAKLTTPQLGKVTLPFHLLSAVTSNLERPDYAQRFNRLKRHIADGDCYQANLTRRFSARAAGDPWTAYLDLRRFNPAPMAAYLQLPFAQILSSSPERFLELREGLVTTKPIKGTRPRRADCAADSAEAQALMRSFKDRAENVMIVDLLRNDLGKVCAVGSVSVPKLFEIESFATVHHLVSTVTGTLAAGKDLIDLLRATFPGGSITGAPKLRAMQIIEELEPQRRGVYCGAIGYLGFDGAMDLNIAIRTLVYSEGVIRFWAGGGIVADSEVESEFQETLDKASAMLHLLQQGPRLAAVAR